MTKYIALASLILLAPAASAQNLNWAKIGGYQRFTAKNAIVPTNGVYTDPSGNTYVAGYVLGVVDPSQVSNGGYDAFVIKYDSSGNQKWVQQFGSNLGDFALAVTADTSGNVYVAGYTFGSLGGIANAGASDMFVSEFDTNGNQLWIQQAGTTADDMAYALTVDSNGNVAVAGATFGALGTGATNAGSSDVFVAEYNQSGTQGWIEQFGSAGFDEALSLTVDSSDNVYIAGYTSGILVSGGSNAGGYDAFVAQYTPDGSQSWVEQLGTAGADVATAVTVDVNGNVDIAGYTTGNFVTGANNGGYEAFVAQFDTNGNQGWVQQIRYPGVTMAYSVSTDANANIYVSGTTYVSLISGVPINGLSSAFSALYTAIGDAQGFVQFGTGGYNAVTSVAWGANGAFYVTGYTNGNVISGQTGSVFQITYKP